MKKVILFLSVLFLSIGMSKASSFKLDAASMETKFASAHEISLDQISFNVINHYMLAKTDKDKVVAGLLGIACGGIGLHRFYLGHKKMGFAYIGATCGMGVIYGILTVVSLGYGSLLWPIVGVPHLIGVIDGILYMIATDDEFQTKYVNNHEFIQWL